MKKSLSIYSILIYIFLYAPIAVLVLYSFNASNSTSVFEGFSLYWYKELFSDSITLNALKNTLILAVSSSLIATVLGTLAAVGMNKMKNKYLSGALGTLTNIPMMNPDIVTGISLMLLFVFVGTLVNASSNLNFWTVLAAHVTFNIPYVYLNVLPKLKQMDKHLPEAALDLGCHPLQSFFKVEFPAIMPGIISGFIMAFTLSLDDFVISYFTVGNGFETLPIRIYSMTKKRVTPDMYALSTLIFVVILVLLILSNLVGDNGKNSAAKLKVKKRSTLKRAMAVGLAVCLLIGGAVFWVFGNNEEVIILNVYNWGEYISDGSDDSLDVNKEFERYYYETYGVKMAVNYTTYASNEDLYAKLKSGATGYDVIIPSDYMIERMINDGMLEELDYSNIPNYQYISEDCRGLFYDPDEKYTVPYTYGMVGIIYNTTMVDEEDTGTWQLLWNDKYSGQILQFNNSRDAFGTAMYNLGIDPNTTDMTEWERALDMLFSQKPIVQSYVMDEIYNKMEKGEAAISSYYAGDYLSMYENNEDLGFYYPRNDDGEYVTNIFIDAMCIPKGCKNKAAAERYIDFMLSEEIAIANAEYIYYASPNRLVYENEEYLDYLEDDAEILYPEDLDFHGLYEKYAYRNLDTETLQEINNLWEKLKIDSANFGGELYITCAVILCALIAYAVFAYVRKLRRRKYYHAAK